MLVKLMCLFALVLPCAVFAGETYVPLSLKGGRVVTVEEARAYFNSGKALFVDVRNPLDYGKGHIPAAIAAPFEKDGVDGDGRSELLKRLPVDKGAPLIFYSHGETGWKSYHAASEAVKAGYYNVMWMRKGFKSWKARCFEAATGTERR